MRIDRQTLPEEPEMSTIDNSTPRHRTGSETSSQSWTHAHVDRRSRSYCRVTLDHPPIKTITTTTVAALAVHIMSNTALTGATYDVDGGQQLVG
jgi:hypothetical protein